ncbi:MAG: glycoside hydrolase, partial [Deltaproteobacteria bacterium]
GNHPSFVLMTYGNEPSGPRHEEYLRGWLEHFKRLDQRRKYTCASGWPVLVESDFHVMPGPRIQHWEEQLRSRIHAHPPDTAADYRHSVARFKVPVISHEIGQWCVYPNFEEIPKYTGFLKARNFEIFRDFLEANHMGGCARDFLMASGKLQTLCYKEEIESALRTSGMGGFQLLDLHDFSGQGTALVGVLDAFWDSKPYVTATEFRRFACETVPLARMAKRVFTLNEIFTATIEVTHYGPTDLIDTPLHWMLMDNKGKKIADGDLPTKQIPTGQLTLLGEVAVPLTEIDAPAKLNLEVWLDGTDYANDWDIWVYPQRAAADFSSNVSPIRVVQSLEQATVEYLGTGGNVLLLVSPERVDEKSVIGFAPVFWNTAWACGQAPHTLGLLCEPEHPA